MELVHAELCGTVTPTEVIETKDKAFSAFKNFKIRVDNESSFKLKALQTNRGGEFISKKFTDFFDKE